MAQGGQYGAYKYESSEARALGSITAESYDRDQAKNLIKLNNDVGYMAAYMRKMQKGIDEANQNVIQQIQSFINDVVVLLGGGTAQGLDFGDLKYVLQMIGALLGFNTEEGIAGLLPLNAFNAVWHMLSTYIFPSEQFGDIINALIDNLLATLVDSLGEIPVVGEAVQQLAVIITTIRDAIAPLLEAISALFDAIGGNWETGDLGPFSDLWDSLTTLFGELSAPLISALAPILALIATWTTPFVEALTKIVEVVTNIIEALTNGVNGYEDFFTGDFNVVTIIINIIEGFIENGILDVLPSANLVGTLLSSLIPGLDASKITSGTFSQSMISGLTAALATIFPISIFGNKVQAGTNLALNADMEEDNITPVGGGFFFGGTFSTEQKFSGTRSRKITKPVGDQSLYGLFIDPANPDSFVPHFLHVTPGQKYRAKIRLRPHASNTGTQLCNLWNMVVDSTGTLTEDYPGGIAILNPPAGVWTEYTMNFTIPAGYDMWAPYFTTGVTTTDGNIYYIDHIVLEEITETNNIIQALFGGNNIVSSILGSVIPGLDTSKITSGTFPQSMLNITSIAAGIISGVLGTGNIPGMDASKITSGNFAQSMVTGLTTIATNATDAITKASGWITGFFNAVTGQSQSDVPVTDANIQAAELAATITAQGVAISALQTEASGESNSGTSGTDDFERVDTTGIGESTSIWQRVQIMGALAAGGMAIVDGHEAKWLRGTNTAAEVAYFRTFADDKTTQTNYQRVTIVNGTLGNTTVFGGTICRRYILRANAARTQYVYFEENTDTKIGQFGYCSGGVRTLVGTTVSNITRSVGTQFSFEAGVGASERTFRFLKNGQPIHSWTDSGLVTGLGANNRDWGFTVEVDDDGFSGAQLIPDAVASISIADNAPVAVIGSGAKMYRSSTATVNIVSNSQYIKMPNSFFDLTEYITSDYTYAPASNNGITCLKAGMKRFTGRVRFNNDTNTGIKWGTGIIRRRGGVDTLVAKCQLIEISHTGAGWASAGFTPGFDATLYAQAGDIYYPAIYAGTASNFAIGGGDASGLECHWGIQGSGKG